jgi:hypothetical protein
MIFKYQSGEEIRKGDRVLFHREPGRIELVATELGDADTDWYVREYGGGVMIREAAAGLTFLRVEQIEGCEDLKFVSRADAS